MPKRKVSGEEKEVLTRARKSLIWGGRGSSSRACVQLTLRGLQLKEGAKAPADEGWWYREGGTLEREARSALDGRRGAYTRLHSFIRENNSSAKLQQGPSHGSTINEKKAQIYWVGRRSLGRRREGARQGTVVGGKNRIREVKVRLERWWKDFASRVKTKTRKPLGNPREERLFLGEQDELSCIQ